MKGKEAAVLEFNRIGNPRCINKKERCPLVEGYEGSETRKFNFVFQIIYACISIAILGNDLKEGNDVFIQLSLFTLPFCLEYSWYKSSNKINNYVYIVQKILFFIVGGVALIGTFTDAISIIIVNSNEYIKISETFFVFKGICIEFKWLIYALIIAIALIGFHLFSLPRNEDRF